MQLNIPENRRILIVCGHYGSGKTEFAVSLAMALAKENTTGYSRIALCDLDVVNPYFRSRERADTLAEAGINVYGGIYGKGTTAEIPELSAAVRTPLEDDDCFTIVDVGGNDSGARILNQFRKYFVPDNTFTCLVVNASRPDTSHISGALFHKKAIEEETGLNIDALVSNTHMLTLTDKSHVIKGYELCSQMSTETGLPVLFVCYPERLVLPDEIESIPCEKLPLGMYMRQSWLDK